MAEQQKLSLCPRLVDYMAIVGARTTPPMPKGLAGNKTPPVQVKISNFNVGVFSDTKTETYICHMHIS